MGSVEVSRRVAASPEAVYALISDLPRMGEWSPENRGGTWVGGATSARVGARFRGRNRRGLVRWTTTATVVVADEGRTFSFDVTSGPFAVANWAYRLQGVNGETLVTESWTDHRHRLTALTTGLIVGVLDRAEHNRRTMETTLERLSAAVSS